MKVFVVGASGVIGDRLVPQLVDGGHEVIGSARPPGKAGACAPSGPLRSCSTRSTRGPCAGRSASPAPTRSSTRPLLWPTFGSREISIAASLTNRLRREGADALLAAAREAGVHRFVAQSFANYRYAREGGMVKTEDDALDPTPVASMRETSAAMTYLDDVVTAAGGIALRYGGFYGAANDGLVQPVRKRQFPIVGSGDGVTSFVHLDDAAAATVLALEHEGPAIYNVVDDEPAPVREWLPVLADALGAKSPRHLPAWLARIIAGEAAVMLATEARGASNAKAKRELGWTPRHTSWRTGFAEVYAKAGGASPSTPIRTPASSGA